MVFRTECHSALWGLPRHAFHRFNQRFSICWTSLLDGFNRSDTCCHPTSGEEIWRAVIAIKMLFNEPIVHRVVGQLVIVIGRPFHAGKLFIGFECRQNVATRCYFNAEPWRVHSIDFAHRVATTGPYNEQAFFAFKVFHCIENTLCRSREIGCVSWCVLFVRNWEALTVQRFAERSDAISTERIVLSKGCDVNIFAAQCNRVGNRVLAWIATRTEDVAVPVRSGDWIRNCRFNNQNLLIFFSNWKHGQRNTRTYWADGQIHLIVAIGFFQQSFAIVWF